MIWPIYFALMYFMMLGIRISTIWNPKTRLWIAGRKNWKRSVNSIPGKQAFRIWFHVSSLGEFEQARPVMEELKKTNPELELILTFFSPSGYEIRKNYALAKVFYLPADLPGNAGKWITAIKPDLAVFVKYDLWPGYLNALISKHIPFLLMSAHFRPGTLSSWSIPPTSDLLKKAKAIFLQDNHWVIELNRKGFENIKVAGDTRIDRTLEIANETQELIPKLHFQFGTFDLVAGSTWEEDEDILLPVIVKLKLKVIIAPHDIRESHLQKLMRRIEVPAVRLSAITKLDDSIKVLVVDSIGQLAYLYALGKMAYIGGGFGKGIHNILEPAAHHLPVIFGPRYHKFPEA
ncbi:MAG TPA: glycosyltransferase N-terminal domain-containing protein, partial [Saprospiraceae bacterium]|nr:glycosyltransferase N-terminal domain-containing protein [Saprospiraceae bacterium]